ncbi:MAG: tetratricopeptide repeat protein [Planctomycetales bacterium]|nr:tetratricopeptide repeat protein [Planctomycetales bacterium]
MTDAANDSNWVIEVTEASFQNEVFERSKSTPVVVDFWATWCQPCRMLGPLLERLADEYAGRFVLAKAETEKVPQAAAQFQVQSIPAVYGVRDGQVVDFFVGLLGEEQIRSWLDRLLPTPAELLAQEAAQLEASNPRAALEKFAQAAALAPELPAAQIGRARLFVGLGDLVAAARIVEALEQRGFLEPEAEKVKAALQLQQQSEQAGDIEACRAAVAENPGDYSAQLRLAAALAGREQFEESLDLCLAIVEQDRHGVGEKAKERMVEIFRLLPEDSPLTTTYRRRLSSALY